jgi:hypothetical protein
MQLGFFGAGNLAKREFGRLQELGAPLSGLAWIWSSEGIPEF